MNVLEREGQRMIGYYFRGDPLFHLQHFVHQMTNAARPGIVIEDSYGWLRTGPSIRNAQPPAEDLGDEKLAVEGSLLVRHDLEDSFHIPTLIEHRNGNDPFNFAFRRIDGVEFLK